MMDVEEGKKIILPQNYYPDDDPQNNPKNRWRSHAQTLWKLDKRNASGCNGRHGCRYDGTQCLPNVLCEQKEHSHHHQSMSPDMMAMMPPDAMGGMDADHDGRNATLIAMEGMKYNYADMMAMMPLFLRMQWAGNGCRYDGRNAS